MQAEREMLKQAAGQAQANMMSYLSIACCTVLVPMNANNPAVSPLIRPAVALDCVRHIIRVQVDIRKRNVCLRLLHPGSGRGILRLLLCVVLFFHITTLRGTRLRRRRGQRPRGKDIWTGQ